MCRGNINPLPDNIKKETIWKIDVNNVPVSSLQCLLCYFLINVMTVRTKIESYNLNIKKVYTTINGMSRQFFTGNLKARNIYPELTKYIYKEHSNMSWEESLTIKFGL